jgi:hypothetical protein
MKSWVILTIWITLSIILVFGVTLTILVVSWRNNADELWSRISQEQSKLITKTIEEHLSIVEFTSQFVPSNLNYMLRYYARYDMYSGYHFASMGLLTRATNTSNGKYSWQIATYKEACPIYGYFYSDQSIYNNFYGYCANTTTIDYSTITYKGFDWGLKPQEAQLVDGIIEETYLPIFGLLGYQTLTHERRQEGGMVSFAEINLQTLSNYLRQNTTLVAMIKDNESGNIIATSSDYTTFQGWTVFAVPVTRTGLSWTVYVGVENVYEQVNQKMAVACGIALAMTVLIIVLTVLGTYCWISKPLETYREHGKMSYSPFDDFHQ